MGLNGPAIDAALAACLCSDGEMAAGGALEDPFVEWPSIEVSQLRGEGGGQGEGGDGEMAAAAAGALEKELLNKGGFERHCC